LPLSPSDFFNVSGIDLQILANYKDYFDTNFNFLAKHGWAKFKTLTGHCGSLGDLQIAGVDLRILANYKDYFDTNFDLLVKHGWTTWSWPTYKFFEVSCGNNDLQILANYLQNIDIGLNSILCYGWAKFRYVINSHLSVCRSIL